MNTDMAKLPITNVLLIRLNNNVFRCAALYRLAVMVASEIGFNAAYALIMVVKWNSCCFVVGCLPKCENIYL